MCSTIRTVRTTAHVTVSDDLEYDTVTLLHDAQRAIFRLEYPDRTMTLGVDGKYFWEYDGTKETEGPPFYETMVLGHQIHAQLLFFEELNGSAERTESECLGGGRCLIYTADAGHALRLDAETGRPAELSWSRGGEEPPVELSFDEWRETEVGSLPFVVTFDDGERLFRYEYGSVTFNDGSMEELRAPVDQLTDEQRLLRQHRIAMDAHLLGDPGMMRGYFADEGVVVYQGEIIPAAAAENEAMMARIFGSRIHDSYDDLVRPRVEVSADGTLGWVVAQVGARGVMLDSNGVEAGPLEFTSAWISMFRKIDGDWKMVGNVSNFKPDPE